jgi:Nuclease-related domain
VSYPRRLRLRRLARAASRGAEAVIALGAAALVAAAGESGLGLVLGLLSGVLALASRRALRLAGRSRVGAESEAQVRRALERLADDGWRVRHAVDWPGRGDLDHVVRAPSGIAFVIETKTLHWTRDHVVRTIEAGRWLARRRRRYPRGVMPVLCVTRARSVEHVDRDLLIVSLDRLLAALRVAAAVESAGGRRAARAQRSRPSATPTDRQTPT